MVQQQAGLTGPLGSQNASQTLPLPLITQGTCLLSGPPTWCEVIVILTGAQHLAFQLFLTPALPAREIHPKGLGKDLSLSSPDPEFGPFSPNQSETRYLEVTASDSSSTAFMLPDHGQEFNEMLSAVIIVG